MVEMNEIAENVIKGMASPVKELVKKALENGENASTILNGGLLAGMSVVGKRMKAGEIRRDNENFFQILVQPLEHGFKMVTFLGG